MKILEQIAQDIVEKTSQIIKYPISITDNEGYIIGSTDMNRIGFFHPPSLEVIKKEKVIYCRNEIKNNILPGVSVPLKLNHKVIGVLGVVGDPNEVENYVQLVKNQVEMLCQDAIHKEMVELKEKMVEMFVNELINHQGSKNEEGSYLHQLTNVLDVNIMINRVCLIIKMDVPIPPSEEQRYKDIRDTILHYLRILFDEHKDDMITYIDNMKFIIFKAMPYPESYSVLLNTLSGKMTRLNEYLSKRYQANSKAALGEVCNGLDGFSRTFHTAQLAMELALPYQPDIYQYNEREAMLRRLPNELNTSFKKRLMKLITPLIEQDNYEVLASTFIGFCKYNMNLSEASRNMFIHRNTIIYRLDKIKEITNLDTSNFEHNMLLYTAIQYYEEINKVK